MRARCWHSGRNNPPLDVISEAPGEQSAFPTGPGMPPQPTTQKIDATQTLTIQKNVGDQGAAR